jgi:uncharacterized protein with von Willebrand factor type A (vWA) domain
MPDIEFIRSEIERRRHQVQRQRGEIRQPQRDGIPSISAEALLDRMLNKIDDLCAERNRLKKKQPTKALVDGVKTISFDPMLGRGIAVGAMRSSTSGGVVMRSSASLSSSPLSVITAV